MEPQYQPIINRCVLVQIRPPQPKFLLFQSLPQTPQPSEFVCRIGDSRKLYLSTLPKSHDGHRMIDSFRFARDPTRIDGKRGDHFLQADLWVLIPGAGESDYIRIADHPPRTFRSDMMNGRPFK